MSTNIFNSVKLQKPSKSHFDLSHDVKLSCNMGLLIPTLALETVPGDKFNIGCESLIRFAPLVSPVMHRMDVTMHYFFCPNRLLWDKWETFITDPAAAPAFPYIDMDKNIWGISQISDYLGIPEPPATGGTIEKISALPYAAYQMVYNEYYRDQNLIPAVNYKLQNGPNTGNTDLLTLRRRAWEHDYFTASLPFAQKSAAVSMPLGDVSLKAPWQGATTAKEPRFVDPAGLDVASGGLYNTNTTPSTASYGISNNSTGTVPLAYDPAGSLTVSPTTINDLRRAYKLQEWLEKAARGGSRYIESILSQFGVKSSDKRLNRPEYITGTKSPVVISEVLNTSDTANAPQGAQAGHAVNVTSSKYGGYFCEEHGYIIGIMSVMPKTAYYQGIPKHFLKTTDPFQYYWPSFANIGEQEVLNKELYAYNANSGLTFGYVPRYAEYKYQANRVAGKFRNTLNFWHMARNFAAAPALNKAFVEADPTMRVFAVTDPAVEHLYCHILHKISAVRPMPKYGTPTF